MKNLNRDREIQRIFPNFSIKEIKNISSRLKKRNKKEIEKQLLLDNIDIRGIDDLKDQVPQFIEQKKKERELDLAKHQTEKADLEKEKER